MSYIVIVWSHKTANPKKTLHKIVESLEEVQRIRDRYSKKPKFEVHSWPNK